MENYCEVDLVIKDEAIDIDNLYPKAIQFCYECGESFGQDKNALKSHIQNQHGKNLQNRKGKSRTFVKQIPINKCKFCGYTTIAKNMWQHVKSQHNCKICKTAFEHPCVLGSHIVGVHKNINEKMESCEFCRNNEKINLPKRTKAQHKKETCVSCKKANAEMKHLDCHITLLLKMNQCDVCSMSFASGKELNLHTKKIHVAHKCDHCEKSFASSTELRSHLTSQHSMHVCEFCDKTFELHDVLQKHIEDLHLTYKCKTCGKGFNLPPQLIKHMKSNHQKNEQSRCNICRRTFYTPDGLEKHMLSDHKNSKCDLCDKAFKLPEYYRIHMKTVHGKKDEVASKNTMKYSRKKSGTNPEVVLLPLPLFLPQFPVDDVAENEFNDNELSIS